MRTISLADSIIVRQKRQQILYFQYVTRRTYTKKNCNNYLNVPQHITFQNLKNYFEELKEYIKTLNAAIRQTTMNNTFSIGKKLTVKWNKDELGDSGWTQGWYSAQVQEGHIEDDIVKLVYFSEPKCVYTLCVTDYLALEKLKLA